MIRDIAKLKPAMKEAFAPGGKSWFYSGAFDPGQPVADYLNADPAQAAGEAMVSNREDGLVDVYIFFKRTFGLILAASLKHRGGLGVLRTSSRPVLPCRPADPVPGRGGPERRACSRLAHENASPAGTARDSCLWGETRLR
jgi:hypothetical protein